jgi:hypothetical protein
VDHFERFEETSFAQMRLPRDSRNIMKKCIIVGPHRGLGIRVSHSPTFPNVSSLAGFGFGSGESQETDYEVGFSRVANLGFLGSTRGNGLVQSLLARSPLPNQYNGALGSDR